LKGGFTGAVSCQKVPEEHEGAFKSDGNRWIKDNLIKYNGINTLNH